MTSLPAFSVQFLQKCGSVFCFTLRFSVWIPEFAYITCFLLFRNNCREIYEERVKLIEFLQTISFGLCCFEQG